MCELSVQKELIYQCNCGECRSCDPYFEQRLIDAEKKDDPDNVDWSPCGGYREGDPELEDLYAEYGDPDREPEYEDLEEEEELDDWDYVPFPNDIETNVPF